MEFYIDKYCKPHYNIYAKTSHRDDFFGCFMDKQNIKITHRFKLYEANKKIAVYGIEIKNGDAVFAFPDLVTDKEKLVHFCSIIENDIPDLKILPELFEDYLF